jgi:exodeoxyribonuclease VII large subunit
VSGSALFLIAVTYQLYERVIHQRNPLAELPATESQSRVSDENSPWQVSQLSKTLKDWIEKLGVVWVEGELSSFSLRQGNLFAELRDLQTENTLSIHAWGSSPAIIAPGLAQGDRVVALVKPQFWAKNGKLSMQVYELKKVGLGELLERIERLRAALTAEGLTAPERKRPLPFLPNRIGLITGANSDAEKDVLQNARLRWPEVEFEVINTLVQGERAVGEVIFAMQQLDAMPEVDVIIFARGGGSFQDLLAFSDESLVRAAAALSKPFVSAIGHENDRPVLDDVADLRASTPTDAAKRVVPDVVEERRQLAQFIQRAMVRVASMVASQQQLLAGIRSRPVLASPFGVVDSQSELIGSMRSRVSEIFGYRLDRAAAEIAQLTGQGRAFSPQLTLKRGYSLLLDENRKPLKQLSAVGDKIVVLGAQAELTARVESVRKQDG